MLDDPEFKAAVARAQEEINDKLKSELCRHGERSFDDDGQPSPCPQCLEASGERAESFWHGAKEYMDGVKPLEGEDKRSGPSNSHFVDTPGFPEPEKGSGYTES